MTLEGPNLAGSTLALCAGAYNNWGGFGYLLLAGPYRVASRSAGMRTLVSIILVTAAVYAALVIFVYFFQARLIYFPNIGGRGLRATPEDIGLAFENIELKTGDGVLVHGWHVPAPGADRVVLFCHGNAGNISDRLESIRVFHELGLNVLIFDYRGYGLSGGKPDEQGTYRDARAAWTYLVRRGYRPHQIIVFGRSLGAAVAAHLAREHRPGALILESPFSSVSDLGAYHYSYLPVRWLSRFDYATADYVHGVAAPVLVIHSLNDEIVPFDFGKRVFERAQDPKAFLEIRGGHNDGFLVSGATYTEGLRGFIGEHLVE